MRVLGLENFPNFRLFSLFIPNYPPRYHCKKPKNQNFSLKILKMKDFLEANDSEAAEADKND